MCVLFYLTSGGCEGSGAELRFLKLCEECGSTSCGGSRDFYAQIWASIRHHGHMGYMLDADWSREILLRCDWLLQFLATCTTDTQAWAHDVEEEEEIQWLQG